MDSFIPPTGGVNPSHLNMQTMLSDTQNNNSAAMSRIPLGTIVTAVVAGSDRNGNLVVRMGGNDIILNNQLQLAKGATIELKFNSISGSISAQLLSVDGKLPPTQPQQVQGHLDHGQMKLMTVLPQGTAKLAEPLLQNPPLHRADAVNVTLGNNNASSALKAIVIAPSPEIMQGLRSLVSLQENQGANSKLLSSMPSVLKAGTEVNLKITGSTMPNTPNQSLSPDQQKVVTENRVLGKQDWMTQANNRDFNPGMKQLPSGNLQLNGMVIDAKPNGEVLVDSKLGKMLVQGNAQHRTLTRGAMLTLELTEFGKLPSADGNASSSALRNLTQSWPALRELMAYMHTHGSDNNPGKLMLTDSALAGRMAAFMDAVKKNDIGRWVGRSFIDSLGDELGTQILGKLRGDFSALRQMFAEPNQQGWMNLLFPVFDGKELHQARLSIKDLPEHKKKDEKKTGTRFIVEIETTYFGELQFDGLVKNSEGRNFDLIIRGKKEMDDEVKNEIRQIFITASEITGFKGELQFATMREFPISPFEKMLEKDINDSIKHEGFEV